MPIIVLILLSLSGGLAYVSKSSLPGDTLYPVKVNIDEPVEEALAFGPKALSAVHTNHALERLREIEQLKNAGKLSHKDEVFTKLAFENELSKINADIEKLNASKDYKSARDAERALRDDLKKSVGLSTLYGGPAVATRLDANAQIADGTQPAMTQPSVVSSALPAETTQQNTPNISPAQSTTTKHVPKLLPQRKNIIRDDDGGEGEDD